LNIAPIGKFEEINWDDTAVVAPDDLKGDYLYNFSETSMQVGNTISVSSIFRDVPFAILSISGKKNKRAAGVLLPVFSLEGDYGIGDFGRGAKAFIDFLKRGKQKYWQMLPLNPVDEGNMYSPYSSLSSMAMNPLLISPELLVEEKLIDKNILREYYFNEHGKVHYEYAHNVKFDLLNLAYENFHTNNHTGLAIAYEAFCVKESYWLDDYSLFMALKHNLNMEAWHEWPDAYKNRDKKLLEDFVVIHREEIAKIKWVQFIADRQWNTVRGYCHRQGIKLFGDLPFYVSYDSVDVWANPDMFRIDKDGNMLGAAGVPPDYFSENGQHWGVPTYNWQHIKQTNYDWWVERLKKNIELFDVVRIDHFRALEAYWEIPPGEETARNGEWIKGPGMEFFNVLEERLGKLPFIAEDLGYEMEDVYALREKSGLPGMKVLQFAFGDNMETSVDIPHNYDNHCIAYTGTHDNNTTVGWYRHEAKTEDRHRLNEYTGKDVNEHNVHHVMAQMAYASVAGMAVLPMQDILGLDETARMNTPGTIYNNWSWRLPKKALNTDMENYLSWLTVMYNRL
jgi:4-alpha-glucanotransferase